VDGRTYDDLDSGWKRDVVRGRKDVPVVRGRNERRKEIKSILPSSSSGERKNGLNYDTERSNHELSNPTFCHSTMMMFRFSNEKLMDVHIE
jgi:hypothetical protein